MASHLASIYGTEQDKVNCSFFYKIGACRHGDRCSRIHNKPTFSQTILIQNLFQNPESPNVLSHRLPVLSEAEAQTNFDDFFEDVFVELEDKYGDIDEMHVCDNLGDHLLGNVYAKFFREEDAEKAVGDLNNRWFGGRPIFAELSPVTDFHEAHCRQYEQKECNRSGYCNFMHLKKISYDLWKELYCNGLTRPLRRDWERDRFEPRGRARRLDVEAIRRRSRSGDAGDARERRRSCRDKYQKDST